MVKIVYVFFMGKYKHIISKKKIPYRYRKKCAVFVPRRIYRSVLLLTQQYIDLVLLRKRLRRRARRAERRVLRLNKKITRDIRTIKAKYAHLRSKSRTKRKANAAKLRNDTDEAAVSIDSVALLRNRKSKRALRRYRKIRKRVRRRVRAVRRTNRVRKRLKKKVVRTRSNIKYFIRYIRDSIEKTYSTETPYSTGNLLLTEYLMHKFLNLCMRDGKKYIMVKQFIKAIRFLKQAYKVHPVAIFRKALLDNVQYFDYRIVRVGRHKTIVVPRILEGNQRILKPLRYILDTLHNARVEVDSILAVAKKEEGNNEADTKKDNQIEEDSDVSLTKKKKRKGDPAENVDSNDNLDQMPFYMHIAHTMLYFAKNAHIMPERSLEMTQIAHDNKRNIQRIVPIRVKKRGERYSRNGLLWNWSKTRTYGGADKRYKKRALKPVPLRLGNRLQK